MVFPFHGMTEAKRRPEGAGPLGERVPYKDLSATSNTRPLRHWYTRPPRVGTSPARPESANTDSWPAGPTLFLVGLLDRERY
jgi:hypothetical protein